MSLGIFFRAEAKTIEASHAAVSWKGKGEIDDLGDGDRVFSCTLTGTILVTHLPEGSAPARSTVRRRYLIEQQKERRIYEALLVGDDLFTAIGGGS